MELQAATSWPALHHVSRRDIQNSVCVRRLFSENSRWRLAWNQPPRSGCFIRGKSVMPALHNMIVAYWQRALVSSRMNIFRKGARFADEFNGSFTNAAPGTDCWLPGISYGTPSTAVSARVWSDPLRGSSRRLPVSGRHGPKKATSWTAPCILLSAFSTLAFIDIRSPSFNAAFEVHSHTIVFLWTSGTFEYFKPFLSRTTRHISMFSTFLEKTKKNLRKISALNSNAEGPRVFACESGKLVWKVWKTSQIFKRWLKVRDFRNFLVRFFALFSITKLSLYVLCFRFIHDTTHLISTKEQHVTSWRKVEKRKISLRI